MHHIFRAAWLEAVYQQEMKHLFGGHPVSRPAWVIGFIKAAHISVAGDEPCP